MIVTLLTDFGTADYFVAAMKGVILSRNPRLQIVDVAHDLLPLDVPSAAFLLLGYPREFPPGTVHVSVVDPGVGSRRRPIAARADDQLFIAPDNGTLSYTIDRAVEIEVREIDVAMWGRDNESTTFHGRDIFAPAAAALASGVSLGDMGPPVDDPVRLGSLRNARLTDGRIEGRVLHIDRFGNCVTSLTRADYADGDARSYRLRIGERTVNELRAYYSSGTGREPFVIWGSVGFLEISIDGGSAAAELDISKGGVVVAEPRSSLRFS